MDSSNKKVDHDKVLEKMQEYIRYVCSHPTPKPPRCKEEEHEWELSYISQRHGHVFYCKKCRERRDDGDYSFWP